MDTINVLLAAAGLVLGALGGIAYMDRRLAPAVSACSALVDMIAKCRAAKADGVITDYEAQMIGKAAAHFEGDLETATAVLLTRR
jgi:hypothetical protein